MARSCRRVAIVLLGALVLAAAFVLLPRSGSHSSSSDPRIASRTARSIVVDAGLLLPSQHEPEVLVAVVSGGSNETIDSHTLRKYPRIAPHERHWNRVAVFNTWAGGASSTLFVTREAVPFEGARVLRLSPELENGGRDGLPAKVQAMWQRIAEVHLETHEWFIKADDDTFLNMPRLKSLLAMLDPEVPMHLGRRVGGTQGFCHGGSGNAWEDLHMRDCALEAAGFGHPWLWVACTDLTELGSDAVLRNSKDQDANAALLATLRSTDAVSYASQFSYHSVYKDLAYSLFAEHATLARDARLQAAVAQATVRFVREHPLRFTASFRCEAVGTSAADSQTAVPDLFEKDGLLARPAALCQAPALAHPAAFAPPDDPAPFWRSVLEAHLGVLPGVQPLASPQWHWAAHLPLHPVASRAPPLQMPRAADPLVAWAWLDGANYDTPAPTPPPRNAEGLHHRGAGRSREELTGGTATLAGRNVVACYCPSRAADAVAQLGMLARSVAVASRDTVLLLLAARAGPLASVMAELPPSRLAVAEVGDFRLPEWAESDTAVAAWLVLATVLADEEAVWGADALPARLLLVSPDTVLQRDPFVRLWPNADHNTADANGLDELHLFLHSAEAGTRGRASSSSDTTGDDDRQDDDTMERNGKEDVQSAGHQGPDDDAVAERFRGAAAAESIDRTDEGSQPASRRTTSQFAPTAPYSVPWLVDELGRPFQKVSRADWRGQSTLRGRAAADSRGKGKDATAKAAFKGDSPSQVCGAQWHSGQASVAGELAAGTPRVVRRCAHHVLTEVRDCWLAYAAQDGNSGEHGAELSLSACTASSVLSAAIVERSLARWLRVRIHDAYFGPVAMPVVHTARTPFGAEQQQARLVYDADHAATHDGAVLATNGAGQAAALLHAYAPALIVSHTARGTLGLAQRDTTQLAASRSNETRADAILRRLNPVDDPATNVLARLLRPAPGCGVHPELTRALAGLRSLEAWSRQETHSVAALAALRQHDNTRDSGTDRGKQARDGHPQMSDERDNGINSRSHRLGGDSTNAPEPPTLPQGSGFGRGVPVALWRVRDAASDVLAGILTRAAARRGQRVFVPVDERLAQPELLDFVRNHASIDTNGRPVVLPPSLLERAMILRSLGRGFDVHVHRVAPSAIKTAGGFHRGPVRYFRHLLSPQAVVLTAVPEPTRHYVHLARRRVPVPAERAAQAVGIFMKQLSVANPVAGNFGISSQADLQRFIERDLSSIDVVLLSDRWAQSLVVLRRYLGWNAEDVMHLPSFLDLPPHMTKLTKKHTDPNAKLQLADVVLPDNTLQELLARTQLDRQLYAVLEERFAAQIKSLDPRGDLQEEAARLQVVLHDLAEGCHEHSRKSPMCQWYLQPPLATTNTCGFVKYSRSLELNEQEDWLLASSKRQCAP